MTAEFVSEVIEKERPDGILCTFGGQVGSSPFISVWLPLEIAAAREVIEELGSGRVPFLILFLCPSELSTATVRFLRIRRSIAPTDRAVSSSSRRCGHVPFNAFESRKVEGMATAREGAERKLAPGYLLLTPGEAVLGLGPTSEACGLQSARCCSAGLWVDVAVLFADCPELRREVARERHLAEIRL